MLLKFGEIPSDLTVGVGICEKMTSAGSTNALNQPLDENFIRRLIEAVKSQPCLYNPNHEHYGNRHANAQYRARVWQKLCVDLEFTG